MNNGRTSWGLFAALFAFSGLNGHVAASDVERLPDGLHVVALSVHPERIELNHRFAYRQVLLTGHLETGETVDLTRMATFRLPEALARISPAGIIQPAGDGSGSLQIEVADQSASIPVEVQGMGESRAVSFVGDVQPALSKMSCNAGTCHGAKDGKNGFKLSLRGYDPLFDHRALTDDLGGRRFNRAAPDQSLVLLKATGSIPHVGGVRTDVGSPYYEIVRQWVADGAVLDLDAPRVASIEVFPKDPVLPRANLKQQISVLATYHDGSVRDVTREAFIESGNIEVLEADESGLLTLLRRGEAPVLVRYQGAYAATTLTVMGDRTGFVWEAPPVYNFVDEHVYRKLERVKIRPSELCTDAEFIRRAYLDLTGLPPTSDDVRAFLDDERESRLKREHLVDRLIGSPEYVQHWTNKWADLLQVNRKFLGREGAVALRNWIQASVAGNKPYDVFARELLAANGSTLANPPAAYYKILREPALAMENTTHLFLAIRFNCNKCHDHPFERWTQDQYYELAAYFAQIGRKEDTDYAGQRIGGTAVDGATPLVEVIYDRANGEIKHDRTGEVTAPAFPYEHAGSVPQDASRRRQLAEWIASPDNPYFAMSYVNRLWGYLFGRGIIDPIDDIRAGNPPSNPALLAALTEEFVDNGFDVQHMLRTICMSRTYQHSIQTNRWNEDDDINYSHAIPRRLRAEVLFDALHMATGSTPRIAGIPAGFRAAEIPDAGVESPFLDDFGRPVRESACECERSQGMVLGPIMKLVNGPTVAQAIGDPQSALAALVASQPDDRQLVEEIFLRFLARPPKESELALGLQALQAGGEDHQEALTELQQYEASLSEKQVAWEANAARAPAWTVLEPQQLTSSVEATLTPQDDHSILVSGANGKGTYTFTAETPLNGITAVRLEALPHSTLPAGGPGRAENGNFVLSEFQLQAAAINSSEAPRPVKLRNATADFSQEGWNVTGAVDGREETGWAVMPSFNQRHVAVLETADLVGGPSGARLQFTLNQQFADGRHSLGRFRLSVSTDPWPVRHQVLPEEIASLLQLPAAERTSQQRARLTEYYRSNDARWVELSAAVQRGEAQLKNRRLIGSQDLAWALINNPAFLFNR
jgi:hypothetical protein